MKLRTLEISGFRCFKKTVIEDLDDLVVIIGDNDSGKSTLLDAVELVLGTRNFNFESDPRTRNQEIDQATLIGGILEVHQTGRFQPEHTIGGEGKQVRIERRWEGTTVSTRVLGVALADERFDDFRSLNAELQRSLLVAQGVQPEKNSADRIKQVQALKVDPTNLVPRWIGVDISNLPVPRVERISSTGFGDPSAVFQAWSNAAAQTAVREAYSSAPEQFRRLEEATIDNMRDSTAKLEEQLAKLLPELARIEIKPLVDFGRPRVSITAQIDTGSGFRPLASFGSGTQRRVWFALETLKQSHDFHDDVIRLYDEPDTRLHFKAQRDLFQSIRRASEGPDSTQVIVCTHAVTLIDRCRSSSIRLINKEQDTGESRVHAIGSRSTLDTLEKVGSTCGISNLALLYERAFLLVEGPTEKYAIPIIYKLLFGSEIEDDGIRVVDLEGCGAWKSVVKALASCRRALVHLLLDRDCSLSPSLNFSAPLLEELGLQSDDISHTGTKEFEDAFGNPTWLRVLDKHFPREDNTSWNSEVVDDMRREEKFSEAVVQSIHRYGAPKSRSAARKPVLGQYLARATEIESVPPCVRDALDRVREKAGILG